MSTAKKLTRAERKAIQAAISRAKKTDKKEISAQDSIPYLRMRPDGICRVTETHYTKTIQFRDINYQLSGNEDKQEIFDSWCDFLNYFDSSVKFQLSFVNMTASEETFAQSIVIPPQADKFDSIRSEYAAYDEYVGMSHRQELAAYADRFPNLASDESLDAYLAQIYYAKANGLSELRIESLIAEANQDGDPYQLEHLSDARLRMEHTCRSARNEVPKQRDSVREKLKSQPVKNSPNYSANFSKGQER